MEEITKLANIAGIPKTVGFVQSLQYSENWMQEEYKLLELPNNLLDIFKEEEVITIRGDTDDNAVICTQNQTFDLKAADTSNSLLLIPNLQTPKSKDFQLEAVVSPKSVCSCFSLYYEVRQTSPKLERLRNLLEENAFSNSADDTEKENYSTDDLVSIIQASRNEIINNLQYLGAFQHDNYWRILDIDYQEKAFSQILALIEEQSWHWSHVPLKETVAVLEELYPSFVLEHCLKLYGSLKSTEEEKIYSLDEVRVCCYYAEYILRPALGKFNYNEFMKAWKESVPDGMQISMDYLYGIALIDLMTTPPVIWHFPERNLPQDSGQRFNVLFQTRTKWRYNELEPYIKNLVAPGQKLSSLLLKYTRSSTNANGEKLFNSKSPLT